MSDKTQVKIKKKISVAEFLQANKPTNKGSIYWDYLDEIIELVEAGVSAQKIVDYIRSCGETTGSQQSLSAFMLRLAAGLEQESTGKFSTSLKAAVAKIKADRQTAGSPTTYSPARSVAATAPGNPASVTSQTMRKQSANPAQTENQPAMTSLERKLADLEQQSPALRRAEEAQIKKNKDSNRRCVFKKLADPDFDEMYSAFLKRDDLRETIPAFANRFFSDRTPEWFAEFGDKTWLKTS